MRTSLNALKSQMSSNESAQLGETLCMSSDVQDYGYPQFARFLKWQERPSWRALSVSAVTGFFLSGLYLWFGLMAGRVPFLAVLVIIVTKRIVSSLTKADHLFAVVASLTAASPTISAGFLGIVPALKFFDFPEEQARLQTSWPQLVLWSLLLCIPGLFFATVLRETALVRWKLPYKIANTLADQIALWHHEPNAEDPPTTPQREASPPAQPLKEDEYKPLNADQGISLKRHLGIPIGLATLCKMTKDCVLHFKLLKVFSPGMIGMGMIAPAQVAIGLLLGAAFKWFLPRLVKINTGSDDSDETSNQSLWLIAPGLGAIFGDAGLQILTSMVTSCISKKDSTGDSQRPQARIDAHRSASVDELSSLLPRDEALPDDYLEHQATGETSEPTDYTWSLTAISTLILLTLLALYWLLIDIPANGLMPVGARFLAMLMGLLMGFVSVWLMGRTSANPVSSLGKLSQFLFILCYPGSLANPVQTLLVVGGVTEAFACTAADAMDFYKIAQTLDVSPIVVLQGQVFGMLVGCLVCPFWFLVGLPGLTALVGKDPFKNMPSAKLWLASARLAAEGDVPGTIWWVTGVVGLIFMLVSLLKIWKPKMGWLVDGVSFALGMCNDLSTILCWSIGSAVQLTLMWHKLIKLVVMACWRKDLRHLGAVWRDARPAEGGLGNRVMLWGSGLLLGDSSDLVLQWLYPWLPGCRVKK